MNWGHQFALHVIDYYLHNCLKAMHSLPHRPIIIPVDDPDIETERREGWTY